MTATQPGQPRSLPQGREHVVCTEDDIPPGEPTAFFPIGRHGVGVYKRQRRVLRHRELLPARGAARCAPGGVARPERGRRPRPRAAPTVVREGEFIYCPWHQWGLRTGHRHDGGQARNGAIRTYPVKVLDKKIIVTA